LRPLGNIRIAPNGVVDGVVGQVVGMYAKLIAELPERRLIVLHFNIMKEV
jgi:hypothetical protein